MMVKMVFVYFVGICVGGDRCGLTVIFSQSQSSPERNGMRLVHGATVGTRRGHRKRKARAWGCAGVSGGGEVSGGGALEVSGKSESGISV